MRQQGVRLAICAAVYTYVVLLGTVTSSDSPANTHSSVDRHELFRFAVPPKYRGATLGPETYGWLEERYGQDSLNRSGIYRASSDDHACGAKGWCKEDCLPTETKDWTLKDLCGVFHCCASLEASDRTQFMDLSTILTLYHNE